MIEGGNNDARYSKGIDQMDCRLPCAYYFLL